MRKILMRAGSSPLVNQPFSKIITDNLFGSNIGNWVYAFSIYRALMTEDTQIVPTYYKIKSLDVNEINENYDCFVIPLADAIRNSFVDELRNLTEFIKNLKIPCYVLGMGIRAAYDYEKVGIKFAFDDDLVAFMEAVLEKSALVSIRGEITAEYLQNLGFIPEQHFTVTGCPSFYGYGTDLKVKNLVLNNDSHIAINNTIMSNKNVQIFLKNICEEYPNHYFYPQRLDELRLMYLGFNYRYKRKCEGYPNNIKDRLYAEDRVRFHNNVCGWFKELSHMDLSIGPRLHGNVAAILTRTPAVWIVHDGRMRELAEYHNLPTIHQSDIDENTDIKDVLSKVDIKSLLIGHEQRFHHYKDFLNKNGLDHIFKNTDMVEKSPLDKQLEELDMWNTDDSGAKSVIKCDTHELIDRLNECTDYSIEKANNFLSVVQNDTQDEYSETRMIFNNLYAEIKNTKAELKKVNKELAEAKRGLFYLIRRKIRYLIDRGKPVTEIDGDNEGEN